MNISELGNGEIIANLDLADLFEVFNADLPLLQELSKNYRWLPLTDKQNEKFNKMDKVARNLFNSVLIEQKRKKLSTETKKLIAYVRKETKGYHRRRQFSKISFISLFLNAMESEPIFQTAVEELNLHNALSMLNDSFEDLSTIYNVRLTKISEKEFGKSESIKRQLFYNIDKFMLELERRVIINSELDFNPLIENLRLVIKRYNETSNKPLNKNRMGTDEDIDNGKEEESIDLIDDQIEDEEFIISEDEESQDDTSEKEAI